MSDRTVLFTQLLVALALTIADVYFGIQQSYYYYYWWFDILTHFLGGLWAGFFCAWLLMRGGIRPYLLAVVLGAFAIGAAWELFEAFFGLAQFPANTLDSIKDLCLDSIGGLVAFLLSRLTFRAR